MYDELVKRLRHSANFAERGLTPPPSELCAAADAIEELTALSRRQEVELVELTGELANKPRWIPVSERLPEVSGHYLICLECKCDGELFSAWMQVAWFCEKFYWEHLHSDGVFKETVTHWMPLPEPPKEET